MTTIRKAKYTTCACCNTSLGLVHRDILACDTCGKEFEVGMVESYHLYSHNQNLSQDACSIRCLLVLTEKAIPTETFHVEISRRELIEAQ